MKLREQLRRNAVALISLVIAITSLGYNTWRNEVSEYNRSQRLVSIQLLLMLGELRQLTLDLHYGDPADPDALLRAGWSKVLTIRDLSAVADGTVPESSDLLFEVWSEDFDEVIDNIVAKDRIIESVERIRMDAHDVLASLD